MQVASLPPEAAAPNPSNEGSSFFVAPPRSNEEAELVAPKDCTVVKDHDERCDAFSGRNKSFIATFIDVK